MKEIAEILTNIAAINDTAREARKICTDIIRQTSHTPYYGKRGAAAVYATEDISAKQLKTIAVALEHLRTANAQLRNVAVNGGMTQAQVMEILRQDCHFNKGQVINVEADGNAD